MASWKPIHGKSLVCVTWGDADASSPTTAFDEKELAAAHKLTDVHTYGLLMIDDAEGITLVTEFYRDTDGTLQYRGKTIIPRGMVRNVEPLLSLPKKRSKGTADATPAPPAIPHSGKDRD